MTAFNNRPFCLKHYVPSDTVTESYIDFVVTDTMEQTNEDMTEGEYSLKAYDVDAYTSNIGALTTAFGSGNCRDDNSSFICEVSGLYAMINEDGYVEIGEDFEGSYGYVCYIDYAEDGGSVCYQN